MGIKDLSAQKLVCNRSVFADLLNHVIHRGREVVRPEQLKEENSKPVIAVQKGKEVITAQRFRDNIYAVLQDDKFKYMVVGIENQSDVHYAMPVRNMLYDVMSYIDQMEQRYDLRKNKTYKKQRSSDFLSYWRKRDRLAPVITIVINWSDKKWTGAKSLHEMYDCQDKEVLDLAADYKLNLLEPRWMSDEEIEQFTSVFGAVCMYMKYADSGEKLKQLSKNPKYQKVNVAAALVLKAFLNMEIKIQEEEEEVDMCLGIEQIKNEGVELGKQQGMELGHQEEKYNMAVVMFEHGESLEKVLLYTKLPEQEVLRVQEKVLAGAIA